MVKRLIGLAMVGVLAAGGIVLAQTAPPPAAPAGTAPGAMAAPGSAPKLTALGVPAGVFGGFGDAPDTYTNNCASCHGTDLSGGRGPSLFAANLLAENSDKDLHDVILKGIPDGGMPSFQGKLADDQIGRLLAYIRLRSGAMQKSAPPVVDPTNRILKTEKQTVRVDVYASGIDTPWGEAFLPDGRLLVTERSGHIRIVDADGKLEAQPVKNTPTPWVRQDGGFFDIAVASSYKKTGWIYLSYSEIVPGYTGAIPPAGGRITDGSVLPPSMTRVVRGRINDKGEWVDQVDIFKADNSLYTPSVIHYGSRFLVDGKGHLFFSLGERGDMTNSQRLDDPLGKIHRVNEDGSIPKDNPFVNTPGAIPSIWSIGNRNAEGFSYDPRTGLLWESEHGPTGGDEINIIEKGHNYGWGVVSMGLQPGITLQHKDGMDDPITYYTPAIGPSGIVFNTGNKYPGWKDNLFLAALTGQKLIRYDIQGRKILHQEILWDQWGTHPRRHHGTGWPAVYPAAECHRLAHVDGPVFAGFGHSPGAGQAIGPGGGLNCRAFWVAILTRMSARPALSGLLRAFVGMVFCTCPVERVIP